ncbi:MAG: gliding motility-associated C-terminal domain-containing protein [Saprospiraceae bacterium]
MYQLLLTLSLLASHFSSLNAIIIPNNNLNFEDCQNGIDDNNDGLIDALDPLCSCETVTNTLLRNPTFAERNDCCTTVSPDGSDCLNDWQPLFSTVDYYNTDCRSQFFPPRDQLITEASGNSMIRLILADRGGSRVAGEGVYQCLTTPLQVGETYYISAAFYAEGVNQMAFLSTDRLSVFATTECSNFMGRANVDKGCINDFGATKLGDFNFTDSNTNSSFTTLNFSFTANEPFAAIAFAYECGLPLSGGINGSTREAGAHLGNVTLAPFIPINNQLNATIQQSGTSCEDGISLFANQGSGFSYQWYLNEVPIPNATQQTLAVTDCSINNYYQVYIDNGTSCSLSEALDIEFDDPEPVEICDNGIDDDGDGLVDNNDPDCGCAQPVELLEIDYLCGEEVFLYRDTTIADTGTYEFFAEGQNGECDSLIRLRLTPGETPLVEMNIAICEGESYFFDNAGRTATGIYDIREPYGNGCDSITRLNLIVSEPVFNEIDSTICKGESIFFAGSTITESGRYSEAFQLPTGCDSLVTINLTVNEFITLESNLRSCGTTFFNDEELLTSGTYFDTLFSTISCDTILQLNFTLQETQASFERITICPNEEFDFNGTPLTEVGLYQDTLQTTLGCDSIATIELNYFPEAVEETMATICEGDFYNFNGEILTEARPYLFELTSVNGCDSLAVLFLEVITNTFEEEQVQICAGEAYNFNGNALSTAGTYIDTLQSSLLCDSIITLELDVLSIVSTNLEVEICNGSVIDFNGRPVSQTGTYIDTLTAVSGCDSTIILELTELAEIIDNQQISICESESYFFNNQQLTTAGSYQDTLISASGCDSLIQLELSILEPQSTFFEQQICAGDTFLFEQQILTETGVYQERLVGQNGCDSLLELQLMVTESSTFLLEQSICAGKVFEFNQQSFSESGTYQDTLVATSGCDSIITLSLNVLPISTYVEEVIICADETYFFNNENLQNTGVYQDTLTNSTGCDSIIFLQLEVLAEPLSDTTFVEIKFATTFEFHEQNYEQSGVYSEILSTENGCDSTVFLNLTVLPNPCPEPIIFLINTTPTNCPIAENGTISFITEDTENVYLYSINGGQSYQTEPQFNDLPTGEYELLIEDMVGCLSEMQTTKVTALVDLQLELPTDTTLFIGDSLQIENYALNFTPASFIWSDTTALSCANCANPFIKPKESTTYQLTVMDSYGCNVSDQMMIMVDQQSYIYSPNAFSPNGDNINDIFKISGRPNYISEIQQFSIFDRWGTVVYEERNVMTSEFQGWNGQVHSRAANSGVYVFMARVVTPLGKVEIVTGEVTLIR